MEDAEGQLGINEIIQASSNEGSLPNLRLSDGFWEVYSPLAEHVEGSLRKLGYSSDEIEAEGRADKIVAARKGAHRYLCDWKRVRIFR